VVNIDNQQLFNFLVGVAGFLGIFVFNSITKEMQRMRDQLNQMPHDYVHKDDYRADMNEVKGMLKQIYEKLDNKADKH